MIQSNLFLLISEDSQLKAYPVLIQKPIDEEGYRYTNFVPLVSPKSKTPTAIAVVHRNALHHLGSDIQVIEFETEADSELALSICLSNMFIGQQYLYSKLDNTLIEQEYKNLVESTCHLMLRILENKPSQKVLLGTFYTVFHRYLPIMNLTQQEVVDFMEILDSITDELIDENGVMTVQSVKTVMENLLVEDEENVETTIEQFQTSEDDNDFFSGLFK